MNIEVESNLETGLTYDDLDVGDVFLSLDRGRCDPTWNIFMKCVRRAEFGDKYYVLDLQTGDLYTDVNMYPVDKLIEDEFIIESPY